MRMSVLVALGAGTLLTQPLAAQDRQLAVGQPVQARLSPSDPQRGGRAFHTWQLTVTGAGPVQIDMTADSVDAFLLLQDSSGKFLDSDDNTGGGTNARINFDASGPGVYRVLARSSTRVDGAYTLRASVPAPTNEGVTGTIAKGQEIVDTLEAGQPQLRGKPYQAWTFDGTEGDSVVIELRSDAFDTFLIVQDVTGRNLAENDDADGELNSRLTFRVPRTARYRIVATAFDTGAAGRFTLRMR